jgi:hypothetical protein
VQAETVEGAGAEAVEPPVAARVGLLQQRRRCWGLRVGRPHAQGSARAKAAFRWAPCGLPGDGRINSWRSAGLDGAGGACAAVSRGPRARCGRQADAAAAGRGRGAPLPEGVGRLAQLRSPGAAPCVEGAR